VKTIYFEGGEPFLYHPMLVAGVRLVTAAGFEAGIVSNAYWGTSVEDAREWLRPLVGPVWA
jgi:pyruvate-formate lyase-activating enzyme